MYLNTYTLYFVNQIFLSHCTWRSKNDVYRLTPGVTHFSYHSFQLSPMKRYEGFYTAARTRESSSNGIEDGETSKFDSPRSEILPSLSYRLYGKYLWCACCDGELQYHPARYAIMRQTYPIVRYLDCRIRWRRQCYLSPLCKGNRLESLGGEQCLETRDLVSPRACSKVQRWTWYTLSSECYILKPT